MWFNRPRASPSDLQPGWTGVEALLRKADHARDDGDPDAAAAIYRQVLGLAPDRNDVKVQLGNMLKDTGRLREAEAIYREAQAADPESADICVQMGHVLKLMGRRSAALDCYRRAVALNPESWAAVEELAEAGHSWQQQQRFEVHFRAGGTDAIRAIGHQLAAMRRTIDEMAALLPDALGHVAFPVDLYGRFRELNAVPAAPAGARAALTVVLLADREPLATLHLQINRLLEVAREGANGDWSVGIIGCDAERQCIVARATLVDPRIRWIPADPADEPQVAEWKAARAVGTGWLLLLAQGAVLQSGALDWLGAAPSLGEALAFVMDEDQIAIGRRGATPLSSPLFRQVVDYDTLLEANVFGETVAVAATAFAEQMPDPPHRSVTRARGLLLLGLARAGRVGHIPYPLVSLLDPKRPSLSEHRDAVAEHIARLGLDDRVTVAKGEGGPTLWRPRVPDTPVAVIIPTRDNPDDLRKFVRSLRDKAAVPDRLRIVIVGNGEPGAEMRALMEDLSARRFVTVVDGGATFNWSHLSTLAAKVVDAPYLVFANDDMLMMTEDWDSRLRGLLERDDVGAVGARLLFGDDTIQHAGILFGWKGATIHDGLYEPAEAAGPARRLQVTRAASAVTGAFLATRRSRFLDHGGFDGAGLPVAYGDIDYGLKLRAAGLKVLWTPAVTLRHYESKTRGPDHADAGRRARYAAEQRVIQERWGDALDSDPSVHPVWFDATMPFRLLSSPSAARVRAHIERTSRANPWAVALPQAASRTADGR